ncbi:MAG: hypothetical protein RR643_05070 [Anaerorhabdus sp.]|uniref:hypothetical protein n=1 Tax=Anaerorhabdus sp. TaxID=1872524 RepID=UPI002FC67436
MNQEVHLTNEAFVNLHDEVRANTNELQDHEEKFREQDLKFRELERKMVMHDSKITDLQKFHEINEATLRYVIKEELQPLVTQVNALENDKFKMAFNVLKWVLIVIGGVVVTFIVSSAISAIVN